MRRFLILIRKQDRPRPEALRSRFSQHLLRFAQFTVVALVAALATVSTPTADKKPNILVIFVDDIGMWNVGLTRTT